jgi:hypothetical protein
LTGDHALIQEGIKLGAKRGLLSLGIALAVPGIKRAAVMMQRPAAADDVLGFEK